MSLSAFNYNWDPVGIYSNSKLKDTGTLRCSEEGTALVAVKRYGDTCWEPLSSLSTANWGKHKFEISESVNRIFLDTPTILQNRAMEIVKNEAVVMLTELYEQLSPEEKKAFIIKHNSTFLGATKCPNCLEKCRAGEKKTCINHQCHGMCKKCVEQLGDKCPVCDAIQETTCPVCLETKTSGQLCKSDGCSHFVCWECYGRSYKSGHPIHKCPLCRSDFIQNDDDDEDSEYEDMPALVLYDDDDDDTDTEFSEPVAQYLGDGSNHQASGFSSVPNVDFGDIELAATITADDHILLHEQLVAWAENNQNEGAVDV